MLIVRIHLMIRYCMFVMVVKYFDGYRIDGRITYIGAYHEVKTKGGLIDILCSEISLHLHDDYRYHPYVHFQARYIYITYTLE